MNVAEPKYCLKYCPQGSRSDDGHVSLFRRLVPDQDKGCPDLPEMVLPERPELAFRPHNLQSNQLSTPESIALYDAAARASVTEVSAIKTASSSKHHRLVTDVVSTVLARNLGTFSPELHGI